MQRNWRYSDIPSISLSSPIISSFALEPDYLPLCLRREYYVRDRRSALLFMARMHSLPFCTRTACVRTERSRSAPQVLGTRSAHGRHSLRAPPTQSHRVGASSPRACARFPDRT
eukprot:6011177-Pleurochrysis_carterae.AAC.1